MIWLMAIDAIIKQKLVTDEKLLRRIVKRVFGMTNAPAEELYVYIPTLGFFVATHYNFVK